MSHAPVLPGSLDPKPRARAGFAADGLPLPPRPEALDEQRIDDLITEALAVHKLEVLRSDELVRPGRRLHARSPRTLNAKTLKSSTLKVLHYDELVRPGQSPSPAGPASRSGPRGDVPRPYSQRGSTQSLSPTHREGGLSPHALRSTAHCTRQLYALTLQRSC